VRTTITCRACGRTRCHAARGLCRTCHHHARLSGQLADYPRATYTRDEVLDEWVRLRSAGVSVVEAAPRLGMSVAALARALERARKAGDPRAEFTWHGVWHAVRRVAS
jgi:hypothetical protein